MAAKDNAQKVVQAVQRKYEVRSAEPGQHTPGRKHALADAADALSRRNLQQARCEIVNEALGQLVKLLYERDPSGELCNVDPLTWRILVPMPWGRAGHKRWGLRATEAVCLRWIMLKRLADWTPAQRPRFIAYDTRARAWFINLKDYSSLDAAGFWLSKSQIKVSEMRAAQRVWQGEREGMLDSAAE